MECAYLIDLRDPEVIASGIFTGARNVPVRGAGVFMEHASKGAVVDFFVSMECKCAGRMQIRKRDFEFCSLQEAWMRINLKIYSRSDD